MIKYRRVFIAIPVQDIFVDSIRDSIAELQKYVPTARWVKLSEAHLTLHFFSRLTTQQVGILKHCLSNRAQSTKPMSLGIQGWGCFPDKFSPHLIWLGVHGDIPFLCQFRDSLAEDLVQRDFSIESRKFHPHVTLGRIRQGDRDAAASVLGRVNYEVNTPTFQVSGCEIVESHLNRKPSCYEILARYNFKAA